MSRVDRWRYWFTGFVFVLVAGGCSSGSAPAVVADDAPSTCTQTASDVVNRLGEFIDSYTELTPEQFLGRDLDGLDVFQDEVAEIITAGTFSSDETCSADDLDGALDVELSSLVGRGLLTDFLVDAIRSGGQRTTRDLAVNPGDDISGLLAVLADGSSITFAAGDYELNSTLLIRSEVTFIGQDAASTTITSSATQAAVAVFGDGALTVRDLTIAHVESNPASVLLSFDRTVDLERVVLRGAVADEDGSSGAGLVLSGDGELDEVEATDDQAATPSQVAQSRIHDSRITDNAVVGITVTGALRPSIVGNTIENNGECGVCYFDDTGGDLSANTIEQNTIGIGLQGMAEPTVTSNQLQGHSVGISMRDQVTANVVQNAIDESEVAVLVGGTAAPTVNENTITNSTIVGLLHGESSQGTFDDNQISIEDGTGVAIRETAAPVHTALKVDGGQVGVAIFENATGTLDSVVLQSQVVGVEVGDDATANLDQGEIVDSSAAALSLRSGATGSVRRMVMSRPGESGVLVAENAHVVIEDSELIGGAIGLVFTDATSGHVAGNVLSDQTIAIQVGGTSSPTIEGNDIVGATGGAIAIGDASTPSVTSNNIRESLSIGIQVSGTSEPVIENNIVFSTIAATLAESDPDSEDPPPSAVGILYSDDGAGRAAENQILGSAIGIQVSGSSHPVLDRNVVDGAGLGGVGVLYADAAGGEATANRTANHEIGFQLSEDVDASLDTNVVESASTAAFVLEGTTASTLMNNFCPVGIPGIALLGGATPTLGNNDCDVVEG